MKTRRIVVLGTLASDTYAGMTWMLMQITAGLRRIGHEAYYFETTSAWPYDPVRQSRVCDSNYAVPYLARVAADFGLGDRWAYRRSYLDKQWFGMSRAVAEDLLAHADAVLNVSGATLLAEEGLKVERLVYFGTDPVIHELMYARGDGRVVALVQEHDDIVTYGENIGGPLCSIPPLPRLRSTTRQPVLLDLWRSGPPSRRAFTTVGNWQQAGLDIDYRGDTYRWSKHHEFLKFLDLPRRIDQPVELATNLAQLAPNWRDRQEAVPALGLGLDARRTLESKGWHLADAPAFSMDPRRYREYIQASRGEFTVARDMNVRLRSGWFSERSACYLAAGRPVITQDTGFGAVLPTGEGLFAFNTLDEIVAAFDAINSDYERHRAAALSIAEEYFKAETVLAKLLGDLGL